MRLRRHTFVLCCFLATNAVPDATLGRCDGKSIRRGDSTGTVLERCGDPVLTKRDTDLDARTVERWYYLPDPKQRQRARVLEFENGALARVRELAISWLRCRGGRSESVRRGDSKSVVIARCGQPELRSVLDPAQGRRIEVWLYELSRRGRRSTYSLTFLDDHLGFIEVSQRRRR